MNENCETLADLCAFNNMINGDSVFPHRRIHKTTWISPDHRTKQSKRPYLHRTEVQKMIAGRESAERGGCSFRPPSSAGQNEDEAKEERSQEEHQNAVQCGLPKGQGDNRGLPNYSQKQIRSPTRSS